MDFSIDDEDKKRIERFAKFCEEHIAPHAREMDDPALREARLLKNLTMLSASDDKGEESYAELLVSGDEKDWRIRAQAQLSLAKACASTFWSMHSSLSLCGRLLARLADNPHAALVNSLVAGERIASFCWSDAAANPNANSTSLSFKKDGDNFVLQGERALITNAPIADIAVVIAKESATGAGTLFWVNLDAKGVGRGETLETLGVRGGPVGTLHFDDVVLPTSHLLGAVGDADAMVREVMIAGRLGTAMMAVGIAQAAYESASQHAKKREVEGRAIARKQAVHFKIADMVVDIESARLITLKAAWTHRHRQARDTDSLVSIAKVHSTEVATRVTDAALQIHGGWGFVRGCDVERLYRDARLGPLASGTSEIQREEIAKSILEQAAARLR